MATDDVTLSATYSLGLLVRAAAASAAAGALGGLSFRWAFSQELGEDPSRLIQGLERALSSLAPTLAVCLLALFAAVSVALWVVTSIGSHKVAGALFRLERVAAHAEPHTDIGRIHLRAGDQAKPLAAALNAWAGGHRRRLESLRVRGEAFEAALETCEALVARGAGPELRRALAELQMLGDEFPGK